MTRPSYATTTCGRVLSILREGNMNNGEQELYARLKYSVLKELDISISEYFFIDMISQLCKKYGWCNKSISNIADDMNMSRRGVILIRDRMIKRGLIIKGKSNRLKVSEIVQKVHFFENEKVHKFPQKVHKVHSKSAQSASKTSVEKYKRYTKNRNNENDELSPSEYMEKYYTFKPTIIEEGISTRFPKIRCS